MQKHPSPSPAKQAQPANDDTCSIPSLVAGQQADTPRKLSRKEISKCINIWARMYRLHDDDDMPDTDNHNLCMPSRPWIGRNPNSIKRFE